MGASATTYAASGPIGAANAQIEPARYEALFVWTYAVLAVVRAGCLFLGGLDRIVPVMALVEGAPAMLAVLLFRRKVPTSLYQWPLVFVAVQGLVVGAAYCVFSTNVVSKWIVYSGLALSWVVALYAGRLLSVALELKSLIRIFLFTAISDVLMIVPRVTVFQTERAPFGATYLLFGLLVIAVLPITDLVSVVLAVVASLVGLTGALLSEMRVSLTLSALSVVAAAAYAYRLRRQRVTRLAPRIVAGAFLLLPALALGASMLPLIETRVTYVQERLESTVFNREDFQLDEDVVGSRQDELDRSYDEFENRNDAGAWIWGFGHGFVYDNGFETTAHVHVTPFAFFLRYGVIGLLLYVWMLFQSVRIAWLGWSKTPSHWTAIALCFQVAACLYWVNSLVGGVLVFPLAWLLIGMSDGLLRRTSASPA